MRRAAAAAAALLCLSGTAFARPIEWIVAVVNHEAITHTEVEESLRAAAARLGRNVEEMPPAEVRRVREEVLENLVEERLLVQEARRRGITIEAGEVREETERTVQNLKAAFANEQEFRRALAQEFLTEEGLYERYRAEVEDRLLRERLIDEAVRSEIRIDRAEIRSAHEARREVVRARHILVPEERLAREAIRRIENGEDFAAVARRVSTGPSAQRGGELPAFSRGQLDPAFEEVAFSLPPGRLSEPVRSRFGWHVIEVLEREEVDPGPLTPDVESRIRAELFGRRVEEGVRALVASLKEEAYVEIREEGE